MVNCRASTCPKWQHVAVALTEGELYGVASGEARHPVDSCPLPPFITDRDIRSSLSCTPTQTSVLYIPARPLFTPSLHD